MLLSKETGNIQSKFAGYCRNQNTLTIPGIIPERAKEYKRLIFNIFEDNLTSAFPITARYLPDEIWDELVKLFFEQHKAQSNQIWTLPNEFYEFVVAQKLAEKYQLFYLEELLYFEWLEIEVYMMEDHLVPEFQVSGNWKNQPLVFNPEFKIVQFKYPVFKNKPIDLKEEPGNYFLLLYREQQTGKVQFIELPAAYTFIIEATAISGNTVSESLEALNSYIKIENKPEFENEIYNFFLDLKQKNFWLGYQQ